MNEVLLLVGGLWEWRRVGEISEVERVRGSVGVKEEHVGWCVRIRYVGWVHKVKCLQPISRRLNF